MTDGPNVVLYVIVITWNFFTCRKSSPLKLSLVKVEVQYSIWRLPRQTNMMPLAVVCFDTGPFPVKYTIIYQENGKCYLEAGRNFLTYILGYVIVLFHRFVVNLRSINALEYHSIVIPFIPVFTSSSGNFETNEWSFKLSDISELVLAYAKEL